MESVHMAINIDVRVSIERLDPVTRARDKYMKTGLGSFSEISTLWSASAAPDLPFRIWHHLIRW